jgi:UMF1 family MFS transporter
MDVKSSPQLPDVIVRNDRKTIHRWAMYDWANSAYALVIVSAIFPAYYNEITEVDGITRISLFGWNIENTAAYSINLGIAFGIVALISPLLSSMADYNGNHRSFMKFFCYMGAIGCMTLFFFSDYHLVQLGLAGMLFATIGYCGSIVFYNAYLPAIATEDMQDKVSARGYAYGYIGATTLLLVNLAFIMNQKVLGVMNDTLLPRLSFLLTGLWWLGFAQIPLRSLPEGIYAAKLKGRNLMNGYRELIKVWNQLKSKPGTRTFLLSFFFYIMGVQTVMFMASSFGEKEIQLGITQLIVTVLLLEYLGVGGAFLFSWVSMKTGNVRALILAITIWILICIGAYFIITPFHFYIAAFFIGLVMGGIQSLSRSTYAKMIPDTGNNAGYFSFYDVCEKAAMMCGLIMFGTLDNLTGSMRNSIFALAFWFTIGLVLLIVVQRTKPTIQMAAT